MTGSNRRPTPCKGAALPTELITQPENYLIQSIFQSFAGTKLWHFGCFDFNRIAGAGVTTHSRSPFADSERTKTHQGNRPAFF